MGAAVCTPRIPQTASCHLHLPKLKLPPKLVELANRIWFIFKTNLHHLIPVVIAGLACFIPCLIPGGLPLQIGLVASTGALATAFSYYSYKLMDSWNLYPYDFIEKVTPSKDLVDRPKVMEKLLYYLSKEEDNNVLVVGERGTGKTTLAEMITKQAPKGFDVYILKIDKLFAVDQPYGHFEKRFLGVVEILKNKKVILFIDEAHRLFHAASGSPLSDRLKPYHSLRMVGVTTPDKYKLYFESDAFVDRFNPYQLDPMDDETTKQVLKKKFPRIPADLLSSILDHSKKLFPNRAQPRTSIKFAHSVLHRYPKNLITLSQIEETFSFEKSSRGDL